MTQADEALLLLSDALDRTVANPASSHCWMHLTAQTRAVTVAGVLEQLIAQVQARIPDSGLGGFYRAAYLDIVTGDFRYAGQAAALLANLQPRDQDRLTAFLHFSLQRALLYAADRPGLVRNLHAMGVPSLTRLTGYPADIAAAAVTVPAPPAGPLRRVALLAPTLLSPRHPPTRMVLDQAEVLARAGVAVGIFSCQETVLPDAAYLLGQGGDLPGRAVELHEWLAAAGPQIKVTVSDQRYSLMRRWQGMLPLIEAARPDLVMLVGLHSGLSAYLYQRYPVLGLATNSVAPLVPTDVWLTAQPALQGVVGDFWRAGMPASAAFYHPFRARRRPCGPAVARHTLAVPEGAVLMISIGNRLAEQLDARWAQRMGALLAAHPQVHWLLLGGRGQLPPALAAYAAGRVHCMAHTDAAMELMASADIYLNPPTMGGGLSVSEAMSLGLPVLSMADSDGGDKLGGAAVQDEDAYFAQLAEWLNDPSARAVAGAALRQHFAQALDLAASAPSLLAACALAQHRYAQRRAAAQ